MTRRPWIDYTVRGEFYELTITVNGRFLGSCLRTQNSSELTSMLYFHPSEQNTERSPRKEEKQKHAKLPVTEKETSPKEKKV